jgi:hypothetical protein
MWGREWAKEGVAVDWQKLLPPKGFPRYCRGGGWWKGRCSGSTREPEDEQRLRETMCERRSVGVRCHDSPHDEAARLCLRTFHTASPGTRVKKGREGYVARNPCLSVMLVEAGTIG